MTEQSGKSRSVEQKLAKFLTSFVVLLGIAIFFGYSAGKDRAMRDNAREAALADR